MSSGKIILGVLFGAAAGALAGILFAPAKGTKTRKRILRKGEDYVDTLKDKFEKVKEEVSDYAEKVKEEVSDYAEKMKEEVSDFAEGKKAKADKKQKTAEV